MRLAVVALALTALAAPLVAAGCTDAEGQTAPPPDPAAAEAERQSVVDSLLAAYAGFEAPPAVPDAEAFAWADSVLATLTLEERVAQMFIVELGAVSRPRELAALGVGGFHVNRKTAPREALAAVNRLQRAARVPLFTSADFEWGVGTATSAFTSLPSAMAYGGADDETLAEVGGAVTALEARAMGINVLFAPVADVNNNPRNPIINTRSFGSDPRRVGELAAAYVRGAQAHGVLATLKHFPGHGNTDTDTHIDFASIGGDWDALSATELAAFRGGLEGDPALVMSTHLWAQALDDSPTPATFSRRALTDVLRDSLGFDGLITTDALNMGAIRKNYRFPDRIVRPIQAGADLVLMMLNPRDGIRAVVRAVERGDVPRAQIDASARRILRAKGRLGLGRSAQTDPDRLGRMLAEVRGARFADALSRASVTVVRDGALPIRREQRVALVQLSNFGASSAMTRLERDLGADTSVRVTRGGGGRDRAVTAARGADVAVIAVHLRVGSDAVPRLRRAEQRAVDAVRATGTPVVFVVLGNPYAAALAPDAAGIVVAYDKTLRTASAVADVLTGRRAATGRLPVTVPGI